VVPLAVGLGLALALTWTPTLRFMGWFLRSLFHETGHVAMAWLSGCPAFPAIDLRGHAVAVHRDQQAGVALLVGLLVAWLAFAAVRSGRGRGAAAALVVLWAGVTFGKGLREVMFLLAGHLGELAFAAVFLRRARTGEAVEVGAERPLYAGLGWYLVASNVVLAGGLLVSEGVRSWYAQSGSYGLENDYLRVARELPFGLAGTAVAMLVLSVAVVPIALAAGGRGGSVADPG
jgi:hypothetical protein